ncbi:MAG: hypothetical protein IT456_22725 [Planctomycetes bacterium]|nr:hypothetical protein [Planctomycetota bacterium]
MHTELRSLIATACFAAVAVGQGDVFEHIALRVASLRPSGELVIDRGRRDQIQVGDRVVLMPRNGPVLHGAVTGVEERTALVELVDRNAVVVLGVKGEVLVPRARLQAAAPKTTPQGDPNAVAQPTDDGWRPGMPLLGSTRPPRAEERASSLRGRAFVAVDLVRTLDSFSQSFLRAGGDVEVNNLRGDGGALRFSGEFDVLTETSNNDGSDLRVYELSYTHGGTRFEPLRWQVGRFLQHDMPEFGILDGGEVGYRFESGDRVGGSFGYLPVLDDDMQSLGDLQFAAWYLGAVDFSERFTWAVGVQKTWHHLDSDRDLVVGRVRYLQPDGWNLAATMWVDYYGGRDDAKGQSLGLTRANAFATRRWVGSGGLEFAYDHEEYPLTLRREIPQTIQPQTLLDAHQDRLSAHAFWNGSATSTWRLRGTVWSDEARDGGSIECGWAADDLVQTGARTGFTAFEVQGATSSQFGLRIDHGGSFGFGRVDVLYELGFVHYEGFPADRNDMLQHRLGGICSTNLGAGSDLTMYVDSTLWDREFSFGVGFYVQHSF